jgi:DNA-binding transcriptional LysR family regulator
VLPPLIAQIKEDYPQLSIELVLSNRMQDLLNREADIAVRMTTRAGTTDCAPVRQY